MKTYTLHPARDPDLDEARGFAEAEILRDGFAVWPFVLGALSPLWFFAHRLWLAGLSVLTLFGLLWGLVAALNVSPGAGALAQTLLAFLVGLEASALRRWSYARKGRPAVDLVTAADRDEAEVKLAARWSARAASFTSASPLPASPVQPYRVPDPVIGFFPEAGGRR